MAARPSASSCQETTSQFEKQLLEWILEVRINKKRPLNIKDLRDHAKEIISDDSEKNKYDNFVVSNSWVRKFMKRNSLCFRTVTHKSSTDLPHLITISKAACERHAPRRVLWIRCFFFLRIILIR